MVEEVARFAIVNEIAQEGLSNKVTLGQRNEDSEGM